MPEYLKRTGRDVTEDILVRVPESEKHIARLKGPAAKRLGIDRGDIPSVAAPLEGQMMIQYEDNSPYTGEDPYYYSNGQWRPFGGTFDPGCAEEHLTGSQTVTAGNHDFVSLSRYDGAILLDLTDPTKPLFLTNGVYAITAMIDVGGASATTTLSTMTLEVVQFAATWPPGGYDTGRAPGRYLQPPIGGGGDLFLEEHRTAKFFAGSSDFFRVLFANDDAVSWNILASVAVTRIVEFT